MEEDIGRGRVIFLWFSGNGEGEIEEVGWRGEQVVGLREFATAVEWKVAEGEGGGFVTVRFLGAVYWLHWCGEVMERVMEKELNWFHF